MPGDADAAGQLRRARAAQQRAHARDQLAHAEWLRQVVVGAALEAEHFVGLFAAGRQHQDRDVAVGRLSPDRPAHRDAVESRQHQVEHDDVERLRPRVAQPFVAVADRHDGQAFQPQVQRDQVADVRLVLDDEDTGTLRVSPPAAD